MPKIEPAKSIRKFILIFSLLYLLIIVSFIAVRNYWQFEPTYWIHSFILIYLISIGVYYLLLVAGKDDPMKFPMFLMIATVVKLLIYGVFCFWMIYTDKAHSTENIVLFFAIYLITTLFEIVTLLREMKLGNKTA